MMNITKNLLIPTNFIFILFLQSCHFFTNEDNYEKIIFSDLSGKAFEIDCFLNNELVEKKYVDTNNVETPVCAQPDSIAVIFRSDEEKQEFVSSNFVWKTQADVSGRIIIALFIDMIGKIQEKRIIYEIRNFPQLTESALELIDVIQQKIDIKPAYKNGQPVPSIFIFSIYLK